MLGYLGDPSKETTEIGRIYKLQHNLRIFCSIFNIWGLNHYLEGPTCTIQIACRYDLQCDPRHWESGRDGYQVDHIRVHRTWFDLC